MTRRRAFIFVVAATVASLLAGEQAAPAATRNVGVYLKVPVGETYAKMECGWHLSCVSPYPFGYGVDWNDNLGTEPESKYVIFRATVISSDWSATEVGSVRFVWWLNPGYGSCNEVLAQLMRKSDGVIVAKIRYLHTRRWDTRVDPLYGSVWGYWNQRTAARMVDDGEGGCSWEGYHAHVWDTPVVASIQRNGSLPNAAECSPGPCKAVYANPETIWERYVSWSDTA